MRNYRQILFVISTLTIAGLLHWLPGGESQVASLQLERGWEKELRGVRGTLFSHCDDFEQIQNSLFGKKFIGSLNPPPPKSLVGLKTCKVSAHSARNRIFLFKTLWIVQVNVLDSFEKNIFSNQYQIETPRALCFLPIFIFLLGVFLQIPVGGLGFLIPVYLFLLSGANIIRMVDISYESTLLAISEKNFLGLALISLWLAFIVTRAENSKGQKIEANPRKTIGNRFLSSIVGIWNPLAYTLAGRLLLPQRKWLYTFFDAQFFVACLSLYLLQYQNGSSAEQLRNSLLLPRYFTFSAVVYVLINGWLRPKGRFYLLWTMPHFWRATAFVLGFEVAYALQFPISDNTLTRFGVALAMSELIWPRNINMKIVAKRFALWTSALFLSYFIGMMSIEAGVIDLAMVISNPRIHPRFITLFSYFSGSLLGFLTGGFSFAFFPLFSFMKSPSLPLMNAALLDGILAGTLLSPFSIFNLVPAVQLKVGLNRLVAYRVRQILTPYLVGSGIYLIASLNSVAILRPATFVFFCLVVFAYQLKRSAWDFKKSRQLLTNESLP